jgi:hypothetical protein
MAEKIFGLTNCENKFLKEFPLSNLQIFLFRVLYKCFVKSTQHIDIWMQIPIQDDVYIWANYSVSSYLNFIPIFWNVLIWLKYDFTIFPCHIFCCNMFVFACPIIARSQCWLFALIYPYWPSNIRICPRI